MKILVTGSKGFVGKEATAELKRKKYSIVEFDAAEGCSILDKKKLAQKMKGVDAVVHLAAIVENTNPKLWEVNVGGTTNVIEAAEKARAKKILFLSTTGIYGFTHGAVNEKTPTKAENNYEKSKVECEKMILEANEGRKISANIVRSAMVFGANNYWKGMLWMLKKKYPLPCSGKNTYQIIYVKELARAISTVLAKGKGGEIYLAAGKEKPTLNEFCEMAQEELGIGKGIKHIPSWLGILIGKLAGIKLLTAENIRHISKERDYDTRKIEKLGWKQKTPLAQAVKEVAKELNMSHLRKKAIQRRNKKN